MLCSSLRGLKTLVPTCHCPQSSSESHSSETIHVSLVGVSLVGMSLVGVSLVGVSHSGCVSQCDTPHSAEALCIHTYALLPRSFSEGGNYSPEEVETFRQKMVSYVATYVVQLSPHLDPQLPCILPHSTAPNSTCHTHRTASHREWPQLRRACSKICRP